MKNWRQIIFTKVPGFSLNQRHICRQSSNGFKQSNNLIFHSLWSLILEVLARQLLMSLVGGLLPLCIPPHLRYACIFLFSLLPPY